MCSLDAFNDLLPTGFLGLFVQFGMAIGYFDLIENMLEINSKTLKYTGFQKLLTLLCSLAVGCSSVWEINDRLRPYSVVAYLLGLNDFPDQSLINRFLNSFGPAECSNLALIMEELLRCFGLCAQMDSCILDYDASGLVVHGNSFEFAKKGYFPKKRGQKGYRLSMVSSDKNGYKEIVYIHLDPGNMSSAFRFFDGLYAAAEVLGSLKRIAMVRADALLGSFDTIAELQLLETPFLIKGINSQTAKNLAPQLVYEDWQWSGALTRIADLPDRKFARLQKPVRVILIEDYNNKDCTANYNHLYTSFSPEKIDGQGVLEQYNQRQTIEALIKEDKNGLEIEHMRTTSFGGLLAFFYISAITYNLLTLFRYHVLRNTGLENLKTQELVKRLMNIPAKVKRDGKQLKLFFPERHRLVKNFFSG